MEKYVRSYNALLWGIVAVLIGLVLMIWPDRIIQWTIRLFGIVLVVLGVIQFLGFLVRTRKEEDRWQYFPPSSVIAVLGGIILLLTPDFWAGVSAILCGILLIILALSQIVSLITLRRGGIKVAWGYYIFPAFLIMAGFVVIVLPLFMANWFVIFVGAWVLAYGVVEIFEFFTLRESKQEKTTAVEVQVVEDTDSEEVK